MIKYYTSSTYRKHYSDLEKLKILSDELDIQPYDLSQYILKTHHDQNKQKSKSKSPKKTTRQSNQNNSQLCFSELIQDLEVIKSLNLTPIKIFKSLLLIHCSFLLLTNQPNEQNTNQLNNYFKWILEETNKLIDKNTKRQNSKRKSSIPKAIISKIENSFLKKEQTNLSLLDQTKSSRTKSSSIRSDSRPKSTSKYANEQIISKQICLLSNIIKPYILYLQKILSIYQTYQSLLYSFPSTIQTPDEHSWLILNIFKLMAGIIQNFNYIGRYFYKQYSPIVYLLIQFFNKQVHKLYPKICSFTKNKILKIQHQWFALQQTYSEYEIFHNQQIQIEGVPDVMMLIDQIFRINDSLYHLYLSKYFHQVVQKLGLNEPKWFQIHSKECEFLMHYNKMKYKNGKRRSISKHKKRQSSFQKSTLIVIPKPFSEQSIQNKDKSTKQAKILPHSQPLQHKIVIEKKNMVPKIKNSLKLDSSQKQNNQKMDTITFRVKDLRNRKLDVSETLQDENDKIGGQLQKKQCIETIRTKIRSYQVIQVQQ